MDSYYADLRKMVGHNILLAPSSAALVKNGKGEVLLVKKKSGEWGFPGGFIEPYESGMDALRREMLEEVGVEIEAIKLYGIYTSSKYNFEYKNGDKVHPMILFFECKLQLDKLRPSSEVVEIGFFNRRNSPKNMKLCCIDKLNDAFAVNESVILR